MTDRERLNKVLAIAINPGSYEQEAVAALRRAREWVKLDPTLAHPPPAPPEPAQLPSPEIPASTGMKNRRPLSRKNQLTSPEPPWELLGPMRGELERAADEAELTGKQWRRVDGGAY